MTNRHAHRHAHRVTVDKGCLTNRMNVSGWVFLLVTAHPGSLEQRAVKWLCDHWSVTIGHIYAIWRNNKTIDKPEVPHRMTNEAVSPFLTSRFRHERIAWWADCGGAQYFCWRLSSAGVHCQSDVNKPNLHLITLWLLLFWTAMCWKCIAVIWSKTTSKTLTEDNTTIFYTAMCSRHLQVHWQTLMSWRKYVLYHFVNNKYCTLCKWTRYSILLKAKLPDGQNNNQQGSHRQQINHPGLATCGATLSTSFSCCYIRMDIIFNTPTEA